MEIQFHSMKERPVRSCDIIIQDKWLDMNFSSYSRIYDKYNVKDNDSEEDAKALALDETIYNGWIYLDELRWQMVRCAHEAQ